MKAMKSFIKKDKKLNYIKMRWIRLSAWDYAGSFFMQTLRPLSQEYCENTCLRNEVNVNNYKCIKKI